MGFWNAGREAIALACPRGRQRRLARECGWFDRMSLLSAQTALFPGMHAGETVARPAVAPCRPKRVWAIVAGILVFGYGFWGRSFAYLGLPSANLFIGDVILGLFLLFCAADVLRPWVDSLILPLPFSQLFWTLLIFLSYGIVQAARGLSLGYSPTVALQNLVFNVYPLYLFLGLWAAISMPDLLRTIVRLLAVFSAIYGIAFYLFLRHTSVVVPGTDLDLIVTPSGAMALIGLPCFERNLRRWWPVLCVSAFLVLASQVRAEWLALIIALAVRCVLTKEFQLLLWGVVVVSILLVAGSLIDFDIPSPAGRGGSVSSSEIIARAIAPFDRETALNFSRKNADSYAGTASWRTTWWKAIWSSVHQQPETIVAGHGYGFPLHDLVPYLRHTDVRTPHNIFFYALGYSGWIGVLVFYGFQFALGAVMFRVWKATGQFFGIIIWITALVGAHFGNVLETPFGAIPFYLMAGMAAAELTSGVGVPNGRLPVHRAPPATLMF